MTRTPFRRSRLIALDYCRDQRGTAAVEMAFVVGLLAMLMLNITDLALYAYQGMQVATAAQVGGQAAFTTCNSFDQWPATANCSRLDTVVLRTVQSTSLGASVTESSLPAEGYYCSTTDQTLVLVSTSVTTGTPTGAPSICSGATAPSGKTWSAPNAAPGDYVKVSVRYASNPIFPLASIVAFLPSVIANTTYTRLN